jgi:branched-chain amino acid transport system ATP-binding protein
MLSTIGLSSGYGGKPVLQGVDLEVREGEIVAVIGRTMTELNRADGVTIVFVEQNVDLIRAMAQRCYVMDKGRIVEEAAREDLNDRAVIRRYLSV